jgi:ABC-type transporter Mla subunit MlaD
MPGEQNQQRSVLMGSAILLGLVAASMLVFLAPTISRMLEPSIEVVALMDDARALTRESPVWIAGREVGTITNVTVRGAETDGTERVAVSMQIPKRYASQIRLDSEVRITSRRLIGQPVIDILPGSPGAPVVRDQDSLRLRPRGSLSRLMERTAQLDSGFQQLFVDLKAVAPRAARRTEDLARIERQLTASATEFRELLTSLQASPARMLSDRPWQHLLERLNVNSRELSEALTSAAERARTSHRDARPSIDRLTTRVDTISAVLADIQFRIAETGGGFLVRSQQDSAIVKGMQRAQEELDSLIAETKRNPLRFWF